MMKIGWVTVDADHHISSSPSAASAAVSAADQFLLNCGDISSYVSNTPVSCVLCPDGGVMGAQSGHWALVKTKAPLIKCVLYYVSSMM